MDHYLFSRAHAIPHSSAFWFVLFLEFSFHRYQAVHVIFSFLFLPWPPSQPLSPFFFFFWIMADQLSFGSLFFSFQSFLIGNGRLGGFLASRGLPLYIYIYILNIFLVSPYYLVHNSVTSICISVQVYVPITLFMAHFFSFNKPHYQLNVLGGIHSLFHFL